MLTVSPTETAPRSADMNAPIFEGPLWYRVRIRKLGPLLALALPVVLGALSLIVLKLFDGLASGWTGLVLGVCAAPGLLIIGVPFANSDSWWQGIALSLPLWLAIGYLAARTATRNPMAAFADFWRAYRWLIAGVWVGVAVALISATALLGRQLL